MKNEVSISQAWSTSLPIEAVKNKVSTFLHDLTFVVSVAQENDGIDIVADQGHSFSGKISNYPKQVVIVLSKNNRGTLINVTLRAISENQISEQHSAGYKEYFEHLINALKDILPIWNIEVPPSKICKGKVYLDMLERKDYRDASEIRALGEALSKETFYSVIPEELRADSEFEALTKIKIRWTIKEISGALYKSSPSAVGGLNVYFVVGEIEVYSGTKGRFYRGILSEKISGEAPPAKIIGGQSRIGKPPVEKIKSLISELVFPEKECVNCSKTIVLEAVTCRHCGHHFTSDELFTAKQQWFQKNADEVQQEIETIKIAKLRELSSEQTPAIQWLANCHNLGIKTCPICTSTLFVHSWSCIYCGHPFTQEEIEVERLRVETETMEIARYKNKRKKFTRIAITLLVLGAAWFFFDFSQSAITLLQRVFSTELAGKSNLFSSMCDCLGPVMLMLVGLFLLVRERRYSKGNI